jgi:prophage regulatory protein
MRDQFLRFSEIHKITGLSRSTIWRREKDGTFPARRKISDNRVAWLRSQVEDWINAAPAVGRDVTGSTDVHPGQGGE